MLDLFNGTSSQGSPIPLTLALSLGVACRMNGTLASGQAKDLSQDITVTIQHPNGMIDVGIDIREKTS